MEVHDLSGRHRIVQVSPDDQTVIFAVYGTKGMAGGQGQCRPVGLFDNAPITFIHNEYSVHFVKVASPVVIKLDLISRFQFIKAQEGASVYIAMAGDAHIAC